MSEIICKFYKINDKNKYMFIINSDNDKSYKFIEDKFKKIKNISSFNPILKHNNKNVFYMICICNHSFNFETHSLYKIKIEIRQYNNKFINIFIIDKPVKLLEQNYVLL